MLNDPSLIWLARSMAAPLSMADPYMFAEPVAPTEADHRGLFFFQSSLVLRLAIENVVPLSNRKP